MWKIDRNVLIQAFKSNNEIQLPTPYGMVTLYRKDGKFYHEDGEDNYYIGCNYDALIKYIEEVLM